MKSDLTPVRSCLVKSESDSLSSSMKRAILEVYIHVRFLHMLIYGHTDRYVLFHNDACNTLNMLNGQR